MELDLKTWRFSQISSDFTGEWPGFIGDVFEKGPVCNGWLQNPTETYWSPILKGYLIGQVRSKWNRIPSQSVWWDGLSCVLIGLVLGAGTLSYSISGIIFEFPKWQEVEVLKNDSHFWGKECNSTSFSTNVSKHIWGSWDLILTRPQFLLQIQTLAQATSPLAVTARWPRDGFLWVQSQMYPLVK